MLRNNQSGNDVINLTNGGTPELVAKPFTVRKLEDGRFELQITTKSVDESVAKSALILWATGVGNEEVRSKSLNAKGSNGRISARLHRAGMPMAAEKLNRIMKLNSPSFRLESLLASHCLAA
jgi:hypothetical protein